MTEAPPRQCPRPARSLLQSTPLPAVSANSSGTGRLCTADHGGAQGRPESRTGLGWRPAPGGLLASHPDVAPSPSKRPPREPVGCGGNEGTRLPGPPPAACGVCPAVCSPSLQDELVGMSWGHVSSPSERLGGQGTAASHPQPGELGPHQAAACPVSPPSLGPHVPLFVSATRLLQGPPVGGVTRGLSSCVWLVHSARRPPPGSIHAAAGAGTASLFAAERHSAGNGSLRALPGPHRRGAAKSYRCAHSQPPSRNAVRVSLTPEVSMGDVNGVQTSGFVSRCCRGWLGGLGQAARLPESLSVGPAGDSLTGQPWGSNQV